MVAETKQIVKVWCRQVCSGNLNFWDKGVSSQGGSNIKYIFCSVIRESRQDGEAALEAGWSFICRAKYGSSALSKRILLPPKCSLNEQTAVLGQNSFGRSLECSLMEQPVSFSVTYWTVLCVFLRYRSVLQPLCTATHNSGRAATDQPSVLNLSQI